MPRRGPAFLVPIRCYVRLRPLLAGSGTAALGGERTLRRHKNQLRNSGLRDGISAIVWLNRAVPGNDGSHFPSGNSSLGTYLSLAPARPVPMHRPRVTPGNKRQDIGGILHVQRGPGTAGQVIEPR